MRPELRVPEHLSPAYSLLIAALVLALDYSMAPAIDMPGMYLLPVIFAAWFGGRGWALLLSLMPFGRLLNLWIIGADENAVYTATLAAVPRALAFVAIGVWIASVAASQRELRKEVAMLQGLLPICAHCKKIRDDGGHWQPVEKFIQDRSDATFTHGVCDVCMKEHYT